MALNTFPGFGLGSLAQGDRRGFRVSLLLDGISWPLLGFGIVVLNVDPEGPLSTPAAISLLTGYGTYAAARIYSAARPALHTYREGVEKERLLSPLFYSQVPGLGLGSYIQGDRFGGDVGALLDGSAFILTGVLSFAALAGEETIATIGGVGVIAAFATGRVWGLVRPGMTARRANTPAATP